jgi:light-regulated signal transduction histidine kinase (bacteriophytochrome)
VAQSGAEALEWLTDSTPDLILLDVLLPGLDGFETCRRIKAQEAHRDLPIIFMTILSDVDSRLIGFAVGGVDYVTKPIEVHEVLARITAHLTIRQQQAALQALNAELARSNTDLQQFANVTAHDLQAPLRMVSNYLDLLAKNYQGQLDARADTYLAYAVDGATRMQQLIDDLLAYARVDTQGQPLTPTDCTAVVEQAIANLQHAIVECGALVTHDALPTVMADARQLTQVFQNLIGNAIKFCEAIPPRVHLWAERQDGAWRVSVRDNGIGIAPEYAERIFLMFERLHTRTEYPGTGLGLAICQKIIERHNGRIWVEGAPGQGSIFHLTLPAEAKHGEAVELTR